MAGPWSDIFPDVTPSSSDFLPGPAPAWSRWSNALDPWNDRSSLAQMLPTTYTFGQSTRDPGLSFDPIPRGMAFDPISTIVGHNDIATGLDVYQQTHPAQFMTSGFGSQASGQVGKAAPGASALDAYDQSFVAAAAKYGVPANLLKAVATEEGGWPGSGGEKSPAGAIGIMQVMPNYWGDLATQLGLPNWQTDTTQNIMLGAAVLAQINKGDPTWQTGVRAYLGAGVDPATGISNDQYWSSVKNYWDTYNQGTPAGAKTTWGGRFDIMFGQGKWSTPDWGAFDVPSDLGYYHYGVDYGMDPSGTHHTGIDIPLPLNSPMGAGFSGHVLCGGTGWGTDESGGNCALFNDTLGAGAGRIEIMSDDGNTVLIYGHSSKSNVRPGQHVNPGDVVGYSGGENSTHVHLEARVKDPTMPAGWRIVDARTVLGGYITGGASGTPYGIGGGPESAPAGTVVGSPLPGVLGSAIWGAVSGMPDYLGQPGQDFHTWLSERLFGSGVGRVTP